MTKDQKMSFLYPSFKAGRSKRPEVLFYTSKREGKEGDFLSPHLKMDASYFMGLFCWGKAPLHGPALLTAPARTDN